MSEDSSPLQAAATADPPADTPNPRPPLSPRRSGVFAWPLLPEAEETSRAVPATSAPTATPSSSAVTSGSPKSPLDGSSRLVVVSDIGGASDASSGAADATPRASARSASRGSINGGSSGGVLGLSPAGIRTALFTAHGVSPLRPSTSGVSIAPNGSAPPAGPSPTSTPTSTSIAATGTPPLAPMSGDSVLTRMLAMLNSGTPTTGLIATPAAPGASSSPSSSAASTPRSLSPSPSLVQITSHIRAASRGALSFAGGAVGGGGFGGSNTASLALSSIDVGAITSAATAAAVASVQAATAAAQLQQERFNQASMRMHAIQAQWSRALLHRTHALASEQQRLERLVVSGRSAIVRLVEAIRVQHAAHQQLRAEVERHEDELVRRAAQLEELELRVATHDATLRQLASVRLACDASLDVLALLLAVVLARSRVARLLTIAAVGSWGRGGASASGWAVARVRLARWSLVGALMLLFRRAAERRGIHSGAGGLDTYWRVAASHVSSAASSFATRARGWFGGRGKSTLEDEGGASHTVEVVVASGGGGGGDGEEVFVSAVATDSSAMESSGGGGDSRVQ